MAPGNPLWMQWVTEKAEEDEERGMESANAFYKAAKAFEKCPTPFHHPEEAICLSNVGVKTIALIMKRLKAHCEAEGEDFPERVKKGAGKAAAATKSTSKKETKVKRTEREDEEDAIKAAKRARLLGVPLEHAPLAAPMPYVNHLGPGPAPKRQLFPDASDEEEEAIAGKSPKKRKVSTKTYVPKMRSGAYGIMLGLYLCSANDPSAWSTKEEIISMGQQYSDTSFTETEKNRGGGAGRGGRGGGAEGGRGAGGHASYGYSAWSNMTALVNKDLVQKNGKRPLAFSLTTAGYEIAEKLAKVAGDVRMNDHDLPEPARANGNRLGGGAGRIDHDDSDDIPRAAAGRSNAHKDLPTDEDDYERQLAQAMKMSREESEGGSSASRPRTIAERTASAAEKRSSMSKVLSSDGPRRSDQLDGRKAASGTYAKNVGEGSGGGSISALGDKRFDYYYLDESENRVLDRYSAETKQEEGSSGSQMARVEYHTRQDLHPMARSVLEKQRFVRNPPLEGGDTKSGFMRYRSCTETAPGFSIEEVVAPKVMDSSMASLMGNFKAVEKGKKSIYEAPSGVKRSGADGYIGVEKGKGKVTNDYAEAMKVTAPRNLPPSSDKLAPPVNNGNGDAPGSGLRVNRHPLNTVRDHQSATKYRFEAFEPISWPAGSFDVILLVDTREKGAGRMAGAGQRTSFIDRLEDIGVVCETRMLPLGDMIWIARRVNGDGVTEEIVLDAIVERKRLDDLCASIKDGRYMDQKIRMNNSALNNRVYVIEKYDSEAQYSQCGQQIWTAKTRIQVNDGFFVYESKNIDTTINYLKNRTTVMKELYSDSSLIAIPDRMIERASYLSLQQHLRSTKPASKFHTTYASFAALNKSDAAITLTMQWGTMVQRVSGYSAEKAVQLLKYWPTPKLLFDSLNARRLECEQEDEMEGVAGKGKGKAKKRKPQDYIAETVASGLDRDIKGKLSERMYELFMNKTY